MHNEFENGGSVLGWLMYKSLGKKEMVDKQHQSCLCPFKMSGRKK